MPVRIEFDVDLNRPVPVDAFAAPVLQAVVLGWLDDAAAGLGKIVHEPGQPRPVAISPLHCEEHAATFQVTVLADWLIEPLLDGIWRAARLLHLGSATGTVRDVSLVSSASWQELMSPPPAGFSGVALRLASPTAHQLLGPFRRSVVLPDPVLYVTGWQGRWNLWCDVPVDDAVLDLVRERMVVSAFDGRVESVSLTNERLFKGCVGTVEFAVLRPHEAEPSVLWQLCSLFRFAAYCGTGVETMRGMGQTELHRLRQAASGVRPQARRTK
ncbi:MAG: CRISPR system precrRNA processing endoribonuclease RAMP protein Cas6 [Armatimonadetes bacterium]|nr:CRISPR system precrRNA processing endoribonuclease RAMP protein Cas6 [Armatimonadota bacterium]